MSTKSEWEESFKRVSSGKSSYRDEAKRLGTSPATFQRRYLNYLESRVELARKEHARLEGTIASTNEKLEGLNGKYNEKDQKLAIEYARKKRAAEAEFQNALNSLKAKMAGEEARFRETLAKKEQEGKRRLEKMDTELRAKDAVISEFKKRGLGPARGLELLKKHEDLRGEVSRMEGLLKNVSASIDERRRQQREEERVTASRRGEAAKKWEDFVSRKKEQSTELDQRIEEKEAREKRLKGALHAIGDMIDMADRVLEERRRQVQNYNQQISQLQEKFAELEKKGYDKLKEIATEGQRKKSAMQDELARLEQRGNDRLEEITAEGQRKKSALRDEIADLERERNGKQEEIRSTTEILNSCRNKIARIGELLEQVESLREFETKKIVEEIRDGVQERVVPILEKIKKEKKALADQTGGAEFQRIRIMALSTRLGDSEEKLKSGTANVKGLEAKVEELEGKLESTTVELKTLKAYRVQFIDGKKLTLEQTKSEFMSAYADEIKNKTGEKYQELKSGYETKMSQLIYERLLEVLKKPRWPVEITNVISTKAGERADGILRNRKEWPSWFLKYYLEEVSARLNRALDDEFDRRVDEKSQEVATRKLERLKSKAWPEWFSLNVKPAIDGGIFKALKGLWTGWTCDKCGTKFEFTLTEHNIGELLRNGEIEFPCPNANCVDYSLLGWRKLRHRIKIPLGDLIARMTEKVEMALVPAKKVASVA